MPDNKPERGALARVSLLQWWFFTAFGAGVPFFSLYYKKVLVSPDGNPAYYKIGLIFFIQALFGIVATPLAGFIADKFKVENRLLTLFSSMVFIGAILISLPGFNAFTDWTLESRFLLILGGAILNGLFIRPIIPLIDTETLNYLHSKYGNGSNYGRIRSLGSAGWICSASLFGWILQKGEPLNVTVLGYGIGFVLLALIASTGFRAHISPVSIPWDHLKRDTMFQRFLIYVFILSLGMSSSFVFTGYFLDDAKAGFFVIGLTMGLAVLPEVPILFFSGHLIRLIGNRWMIIGGCASISLKLALFVLIAGTDTPWLFVVVNVLHGIGYSLQFSGMINLIDRQAHKDLRATYQNLFHLVWALSMASSGLFSSVILKHLSSSWLMGIDSSILLFAVLYFMLVVKGHGPLSSHSRIRN